MKKKETPGPVHKIPTDFREAMHSTTEVKTAWESLTPLGRNEWICWVISAKKADTRKQRIQRATQEIKEGKRRPCCWPGCPHRRPSAKKWF